LRSMCQGGITRASTLALIALANFFASAYVSSGIGAIEFG